MQFLWHQGARDGEGAQKCPKLLQASFQKNFEFTAAIEMYCVAKNIYRGIFENQEQRFIGVQ